MAFTFTHYIYPLQKEIVLSKALGYSLDNPRTKEEMNLVLAYLQPAINLSMGSGRNMGMIKHAWELTLNRIRSENHGHEEHLIEALSGEPKLVLARNWVILRYEDKGEFDNIRKNLNRLIDLGSTEEGEPFVNTYSQLAGYGHLLQLFLIESHEFYGQPLTLLPSAFAIFEANETENIRSIAIAISQFEANFLDDPSNFGYSWRYFPRVREKMMEACGQLEKALTAGSTDQSKPSGGSNSKSPKAKDDPKNRILYVGDLLRIIYSQSHDLKVKYILLVSILELLLTHAPDATKNVENSITKQFILKLTVLLYLDAPDMDLSGQKKKLSDIYANRSAIAHGGELPLSAAELRQQLKQLYSYVKIVFTRYITDGPFVEFLKAN
jgi:hypothetical protein